MSETIYLLTLFALPATLLLIFGMKYYSATQQAKVRQADDATYRQLAAQAVAAQAETAAALTSIGASLAELTTRVAAVEKILKQVE
jgi:hypothetical protein